MILRGHVLDVLKTLPSESVQCVVTSPPYWALRRYDIPDVVFDGDPSCKHEWTEVRAPWANAQPGPNGAVINRVDDQQVVGEVAGYFCCCGAWRGQLGQEPTVALYIQHMVDVFREVRRVLRPDGVCWINIGDCYANADKGGYQCSRVTAEDSIQASNLASDFVGAPNRSPQTGLKNKDLVGIPWALAFALRDDGWYLRSEIVWTKGLSFCESYAGSVMPESVRDRPTRSHEQIFLLTKNERYFYDHEAVKETGVYPAGTRAAKGSGTREGNRRGTKYQAPNHDAHGMGRLRPSGPSGKERKQDGHGRRHAGFNERYFQTDDDGYATYDGRRNLRTCWAIGVEPYSEAHFATYPPSLVDPMVRAGTSEKGACGSCGAPWKRVVEYEPMPEAIRQQFESARVATATNHGRDDGFVTRRPNYVRKRIGEHWKPTCVCGAASEVVPCVVLDPFAGSGSSGVAVALLQRRFLGIELGAGYIAMAERRIGDIAPLFAEPSTADNVAPQPSILSACDEP